MTLSFGVVYSFGNKKRAGANASPSNCTS